MLSRCMDAVSASRFSSCSSSTSSCWPCSCCSAESAISAPEENERPGVLKLALLPAELLRNELEASRTDPSSCMMDERDKCCLDMGGGACGGRAKQINQGGQLEANCERRGQRN